RPFRYVLFGVVGLVAGFLALAIAVPLEPQVIAPVIALFSPGLKLAEFVTPESGKSFAWTFGWFLRIAILANGVFYFAIFSLLAYFVGRSRSEEVRQESKQGIENSMHGSLTGGEHNHPRSAPTCQPPAYVH